MRYRVTWTVEVDAPNPQRAAGQARNIMINPSRTKATFEVQLVEHVAPVFVTVQDPDRSGS